MSGIPTPSATSSKATAGDTAISIPAKSLRRWLYFALVISSSVLGGWMMLEILGQNGLTVLETLLLLLFVSTFTWVVSAFWSAAIGFLLQLLRRDPYTLRRLSNENEVNTVLSPAFNPVLNPALHPTLQSRTAVIMPVYNEDTARVFAGLESTIRSLADYESEHEPQTKQLTESFDFYLLSDTQDPTLIDAELVAWQLLQSRLGTLSDRVYYRRRENNTNRKVGNIADFCQRWGSQYEHMLILDADSVMTGDCMVKLAARMEANPQAGLIQTIPIPVRQETFFGRFVQFAATLYSPMLATGYAFWQTDNANYWGHNAIIRVAAFVECCGLPTLSGRSPFGGEILSHDFVEAALLYRGGWSVYIATDLEGSFEEVPANIIDYATRDRRWVQGNLQHLGLLKCSGLSKISRLHFLFGALAYGSSLAWLCMLLFSTIDAVVRATSESVFFDQTHQLFPSWPTAKPELIMALLYLTVTILFAPKVMGVINAMVHRRAAFGGFRAIIGGALLELLFAIIVAPVMMLFHAYFVICSLLGFKVSWDAQPREGRMVSWREAWRRGYCMVIIAALWGGITAYFSPLFFYWTCPVLFGMLITPALIRYGSSKNLGLLARRFKLMLAPTEQIQDPTLQSVGALLAEYQQPISGTAPIPELPAETWQPMHIQQLQRSKRPYSENESSITVAKASR